MHTLTQHDYEWVAFFSTKEDALQTYEQLSGSFAIVQCKNMYVMCYNTWRQQWELPAGKRELHETPKQCAIRELYEETGQMVPHLTFQGIAKMRHTATGQFKYNPVYFGTIPHLQPFVANHETSEICLWDLQTRLPYVDAVDFALLTAFAASIKNEKT